MLHILFCSLPVRACVRACANECVCVHACARARVRACVSVCVCVWLEVKEVTLGCPFRRQPGGAVLHGVVLVNDGSETV